MWRAPTLIEAKNDLQYFITPDRPIRQAHFIMAKQHRALTTFSSLFPFHKFPLIWNELPSEIREIKNTITFKHRLRIDMLDKYENR